VHLIDELRIRRRRRPQIGDVALHDRDVRPDDRDAR
jgi:hypothetical protein